MADGIFRCTVCGTRYLAPSRCCGEAGVAGVLSSGEPSVSLVLLASARGDLEPELVTALRRTPGSAALEVVLVAGDPRGEWLARCGARVRMLRVQPRTAQVCAASTLSVRSVPGASV